MRTNYKRTMDGKTDYGDMYYTIYYTISKIEQKKTHGDVY